jgi:hypothetical protein
MNILLTYYLFLAAGAVLLAALKNSPTVRRRRSHFVGYALMPPVILLVLALNAGFVVTLLLLAVLAGCERLLRRFEEPATEATGRLWLSLWLIEAVLPISLHIALKAHPELERVALLIIGVVLVAVTLLGFFVLAPDLRQRA